MEDRGSKPISGWRLGNDVKGPATYPRGRGCQEPGCWTVLSIYNAGWYCAGHELKRLPRLIGRKAS